MSLTPRAVTRGAAVPIASADRRDRFTEGHRFLALLLLGGLLLPAGLAAVTAGSYDLSLGEVWSVLSANILVLDSTGVDAVHQTIVWEIRLPRVLVGILVGMALSGAGAVYQGCFRNPLVEPFILGVSAGASLGAALGILYPQLFLSTQFAAFISALIAVGLVYTLSRVDGSNPTVHLILAGVIIGSLFQAAVSVLKYLSDDAGLRAIVFWIMGGLYYAGWSDVAVLGPIVLAGVAVTWLLSWRLNVLSLGDVEARTLGVHPERLKLLFIVTATLMTAVSVASVGIIAWVGLMTPHAARMLFGPDHRYVIPAAALLGALYLLLCDTLARTLIGTEIPISILTSILGAPYLFYLLRSRGRPALTE
jgi:iron complex transport system permease protein